MGALSSSFCYQPDKLTIRSTRSSFYTLTMAAGPALSTKHLQTVILERSKVYTALTIPCVSSCFISQWADLCRYVEHEMLGRSSASAVKSTLDYLGYPARARDLRGIPVVLPGCRPGVTQFTIQSDLTTCLQISGCTATQSIVELDDGSGMFLQSSEW